MSRMTIKSLKTRMDYQRWDPFSPPAWPWICAQRIHDTQFGIGTIRQHCGQWIARAVEHLRLGGGAHPEIATARDLYATGGHQRDELEARLLAGHSDHRISARMRIPPPVVAAYAGLFYAVRDRLGASCWILNVAIDWRGSRAPLSLGKLLRYMTYHSGDVVLESLLPVLRKIGRAMTDGTTHELRTSDPSAAAVYRVIQLLSREITSENIPVLFRAHLRLMRSAHCVSQDAPQSHLATPEWYDEICDGQLYHCPDAAMWAGAAA